MLIDGERCTVGSLSGGCLEEEVAQRAQELLRSGEASLMSFDTRRRFGCNGTIEILIERLEQEFIQELAGHLQRRRKCFVATVFTGNEATLGSAVLPLGAAAPDGAFVQEIHPRPQLIIFGDGPDSAPLRLFCRILGWEAIEVENASDLPEEADEWTAAIIKSHNYGRDFAALRALLPLPFRYLGLIGPRLRRDQLLADVLDSGVLPNADLFAPTGLDLGSETPEEIALATIAEVQRAFSRGTGVSLREVKAPIHHVPAFASVLTP